MRVLLTGGGGFVGAHVRKQMNCIALADGHGASIDLRNGDAVCRAVADLAPDAVIHLAAQSFVPTSFRDPLATFDINFTGTFNLLFALKSCGFTGRFLYVGSSDTYGIVAPSELPVKESSPLRPRNPYAVSKVAAEALCYQWSQTESFKIVMARPFNHIGPGQSPRFVIADFAQQVLQIKRGLRSPIIAVGDIDVTRDFTDVRDVVRAYLTLLTEGESGEIYNVCSSTESSIRAILQSLCTLADIEAQVIQDAERMRASEQRRVCGSFAKLHSTTGWKPEISLEESLSDLLTDLSHRSV